MISRSTKNRNFKTLFDQRKNIHCWIKLIKAPLPRGVTSIIGFINTGAKLTHLFADFERFLAEIVAEIDDFGAFRPKFAPNRPRKRLENRRKEVKTRKIVIKPIETQKYSGFLQFFGFSERVG